MIPEPPGILLGRPPDDGAKCIPFLREITGRERVDVLQKQGIASKMYREIKPDIVLRLIAKIALGFAVTGYGLDSFDPSAIRKIILRRDTNPYYLVGGTTADMNEFPTPRGKIVAHRIVGYKYEIGLVPYLLFQIQLFTYLNAPIYTVAVGKLTQTGLNKLNP
jgi:hypothetical protein